MWDLKANMGAEPEHVVHLLWCRRDQRDAQHVVIVFQVLQMIVKFTLTGMSETCGLKAKDSLFKTVTVIYAFCFFKNAFLINVTSF